MFESLGRGFRMIQASIRMGLEDKRLLLPSFLTVLTNFLFGFLLFGQGLSLYKSNSGGLDHAAEGASSFFKHLGAQHFGQSTQINGPFDPNGWSLPSVNANSDSVWPIMAIICVWWLTNRFLEGVTTALVYSHLTEGPGSGSFKVSCMAVLSSLPAIICLGIATLIANQLARLFRNKGTTSVVGVGFGFLAGIVQVFWTIAGHLILPAIVIEGTSFMTALKRADRMASGNLLTIGFGEVGIDTICRIMTALVFAAGVSGYFFAVYTGMLYSFNFYLGGLIWAFTVVFITAASVYIRAAFYTCLYVWAIEAESVTQVERRKISPPKPLAQALA